MSFDSIVNLYTESKTLPFRIYIEQFSLFRMCGSMQNKSVLDLACGDGSYTQESLKRGADSVVGVDISEPAIAMAKENNSDIPSTQFLVHDVKHLPKVGEFDIVLGAYLLNHAKSREELILFAKAIYDNLKTDGKFVGINDNPGNAPEFYKKYKKYGFLKS